PASAYSLVFSPDGKQLAGIGPAGTVNLWDLQVKKATTLGSHGKTGWAVTFSSDGKTLASGSNGKTGWAVAFSSDGKTLASGGSDRTARLWDVATKKELTTLDATACVPFPVTALAYAPDGKAVALASTDNVVRLHDARTGR